MKRPAPVALFPGAALAHQGGWDEILLVVAPLAIIGGLLWLANRRVTAQLEAEAANSGDSQTGSSEMDEAPSPPTDGHGNG